MIEVLVLDKVEKKVFPVPEAWVPIMTNPLHFRAEYMKQIGLEARYYVQSLSSSTVIPDDAVIQISLFFIRWSKVREGHYKVVPNTSAAKVLYGD